MMEMSWWVDPKTGDRCFRGTVSNMALADIELSSIDRAILAAPEVTAADVLQSLELLFRRYHEQRRDYTTSSA